MRVAILGRTRMLYDTIQLVLDAGHDIALIGTCKAAPEYDIREMDFEKKAVELKVPFFCDSRINSDSIIDRLIEVQADIAVSVNWLNIIGEKAINCFKLGILNAHCGDLPRYRGNACPNWAIINNESQIGVAVHYMDPNELDAGDIVLKRYYSLSNNTTITDIYSFLEKNVPIMFVDALNKIANGTADVVHQSNDKNSILRCYPRMESDSYIDWAQTMDNIDRVVRASCSPFNGAYTYYKDKKYYIQKITTREFNTPVCVSPGQIVSINKSDHIVGVACADGVVLIEKLVDDNGEVIYPEMAFSSMRMRLGYSISDEIFLLRKEIFKLKEMIQSGD